MANDNPIQGLPDILARGLGVVFCGINPGMRSAALGYHFAGRGNRFWRVLHLSGFTPQQLLPENARSLLSYGCGLTSAVEKPTVCANDLKRTDFVQARPELERKIRRYAPNTVAFLGKGACSVILNQRELSWGQQDVLFAGAAVWVLPNPSGLNCAFTLASLTAAYRELWESTASSTEGMRTSGLDSWSSNQRFRSIPPP
jgi:TDG/mug DNA glycosylase family protein